MGLIEHLAGLRQQRASIADALIHLPARCKGCAKRRATLTRQLATVDDLLRELGHFLISRRWP